MKECKCWAVPLLGGLVTETVTSDLDSRQWLGNWAVQRGAESTYDPRHYPSPAFDRRKRCCNRAVCKSTVVGIYRHRFSVSDFLNQPGFGPEGRT